MALSTLSHQSTCPLLTALTTSSQAFSGGRGRGGRRATMSKVVEWWRRLRGRIQYSPVMWTVL